MSPLFSQLEIEAPQDELASVTVVEFRTPPDRPPLRETERDTHRIRRHSVGDSAFLSMVKLLRFVHMYRWYRHRGYRRTMARKKAWWQAGGMP